MKRWLGIGAVSLIGVLVVVVAGGLIYLTTADLSRYQDEVEAAISDALGRDFSIQGQFQPEFGTLSSLTAENVQLTNTDWAADPVMASIERLHVVVDLWSVLSKPVLIEKLEVKGVNIFLEKDAAQRTNWVFAEQEASQTTRSEFEPNQIVFKNVSVDNVTLIYRDPARQAPVNLQVERLTVKPDESDLLDLDLLGTIGELDLVAAGQVGPLEGMVNGKNVTADLSLSVGQSKLLLQGSVMDLAELEGLNLSLALDGPAIERVVSVFGIAPFADGPFQLEGNTSQTDNQNHLTLAGDLGDISVSIEGDVDKLLIWRRAQMDFKLAGPDAGRLASSFGVPRVRNVPFELNGKLDKNENRFGFANISVSAGENSFDASGFIDLTADISGDVTINASGPDLSVVGPIAHVPGIPSEAFAASGQIVKDHEGWRFNDVTAHLADNRLALNGTLGVGQKTNDTDVRFTLTGPNLSTFETLIGREDVPARAFDISAHVLYTGSIINIEEAQAALGENRLNLSGELTNATTLSGARLNIVASGPNLAEISVLGGLADVPPEPFEFRGTVSPLGNTYSLEGIQGSVGEIQLEADGTIAMAEGFVGTDLQISLRGPDIATFAKGAGIADLPSASFGVKGRGSVDPKGYQLHNVEADIGALSAVVDGRLDPTLDFSKTNLNIRVTAPDTTLLGDLVGFDGLPAGRLEIVGQTIGTTQGLEFEDTHIKIGELSAQLRGKLGEAPKFVGTDLDFDVSGPDLRAASQPFGIDVLPDRPFNVSAHFQGTPKAFSLDHFSAKIGENVVNGEFSVDLTDRPNLTGQFSTGLLDLTPATLSQEGQQAAAADDDEADALMFSDKPIDATRLDMLDAHIDVNIDRLIRNQIDARNIRLSLILKDGAARLEPISFTERGADFLATAALTPNNPGFGLVAQAQATQFRLGLLTAAGDDPTNVPPLDLDFELAAAGISPHALAASANGKLEVIAGSGQVNSALLGRLFSDVAMQLIRTLNPFIEDQTHLSVECGLYIVDIENGLATIRNLALQTNKLTILGQGTINLDTENVDLVMRTKPREGLGVSIGGLANSFVKLGGTLKNPGVQLDTKSAVATTGAAVATGGISLLAKSVFDRVTSEEDVCTPSLKPTETPKKKGLFGLKK